MQKTDTEINPYRLFDCPLAPVAKPSGIFQKETTMIKVILWDIDGTLLDFKKSESFAIKKCFFDLGIGECTDEMVARYSVINHRLWNELAEGKHTKKEVLNLRFEEFFKSEGINYTDYEALNAMYQVALGEYFFFFEDGKETLLKLKGKYKQYAVTNGTAVAQHKKLALSGLDKIFDGVFISDEVGVDKPHKEFFDKVFETIGDYKKDEVVIIGDSVLNDMQGGNNAGIRTVLFDPNKNAIIPKTIMVDKIISRLNEVEKTVDNL